MVEATKKMFQNYANFSGRTTRRDYWLAWLGMFLISFVVSMAGMLIFGTPTDESGVGGYSILTTILWLVTFIPMLAIDVRRLHDINKSGWWIFISLVPLVGGIIFLVFMCSPSVDEGNNY